jgi:hypothetical protein
MLKLYSPLSKCGLVMVVNPNKILSKHVFSIDNVVCKVNLR